MSREEASNVDPALLSLSRKCSNCGQAGHNSRTCLEFREPTASEAEHKSHTADSVLSHPPQHIVEQAADRAGREGEDGEASDCSASVCRESKKKGVPWTEEEHKLFLIGLQKLGKGDWRGISRQFVQTRSPTQVASHAQKYFIRQSVVGKRKRRSSLFDLVPDGLQDLKEPLQSHGIVKSKPDAGPSLGPNETFSPKATGTPNAQGAEAFAWALYYQSMLMWAMYGQMPQHSVAQGNPGLSAADTRDMAATLAAQQQAAAYMAQQQFSAALALGTLPCLPTPPEDGVSGKPGVKSDTAAPAGPSGRMSSVQASDSFGISAGRQNDTDAQTVEVFGNGRLVKPKAQRAQSVQSFGSIPSYMLACQSDGAPQMTTCSKDSQDSFARLAGITHPADPSSLTGGLGSTLAFSASNQFEKSTASKGNRLKHTMAQ